MAKIPVGDTINFAYSNTFGNILPLLGLTWLPLAIAAGLSYYVQTLWFEWLAQFPSLIVTHGQPDPQALMRMFSNMGGMAGLGFLTTLVTFFMSAVVGVAVTQQALRQRSGQTFVHLAAGSLEWRVFGGYIRSFFAILGLVALMGIGIGIAVALAAVVANSSGGSAIGSIIAAIVIIAIVCLTILTIVRMMFLLVPSIVMEPGKGGLARSYHLTRGNFWRIFVLFLVLVLPVAIVAGGIQNAIIGTSMMGPFESAAATFAGHADGAAGSAKVLHRDAGEFPRQLPAYGDRRLRQLVFPERADVERAGLFLSLAVGRRRRTGAGAVARTHRAAPGRTAAVRTCAARAAGGIRPAARRLTRNHGASPACLRRQA